MIRFERPQGKYIQSFWEALDSVAREERYLSMRRAFPLEGTKAFVNNTIKNNYPQLFVIEDETDTCVGWCDALPRNEQTGALGIGLLPQYRERGIGKRVIKEIIQMSKDYGYTGIELDVFASNGRAIHVYKTLGFKTTGVTTDGWQGAQGNTVTEEVVQMRLELDRDK
jgi:ribosomal protein S18 acetylase RimI-like enzyme